MAYYLFVSGDEGATFALSTWFFLLALEAVGTLWFICLIKNPCVERHDMMVITEAIKVDCNATQHKKGTQGVKL